MNGVSHMLPFVVGGGVLIALGFLFDTLAGNADVGGTFGFTSPVAAIVFWIGKAAFALMLPILFGLYRIVRCRQTGSFARYDRRRICGKRLHLQLAD